MRRRSLARPFRAHKLNLLVTALALIWNLGLWAFSGEAHPAQAQVPINFPETGFTVSDPFLSYWQARGGLFSYGYPITGLLDEDGMQVQYFERARFEWHPQNASTPYEVLLSPLGAQLTEGRSFPPPLSADAVGGAYFPETGHSMKGQFLSYWNAYGGLARFGYPISEEIDEISAQDNHPYRVQYFERARMELHPENAEPYNILLGQIGRQMLTLRDHAQAYVTAQGDRLVYGRDLATLMLKGFNYFPRDYAWADFEQWPAERVSAELDTAHNLGANTLRVFIRMDAFGGPEANWGQQEGFERFVAMAKARGFRLVVGLFDSYRKWPAEGWDAWPAFGTPGEIQDRAYLRAVVSKWKDEPAILAWDVYNEPDFVGDKEFRWAEHRLNRISWLERMSTEVRRLDHNHLLTIGVALAESNLLPGVGGITVADLVDFVSVHYYERNYSGKRLYSVLEEMKQVTYKPIVVEEIGQATLVGGADMSGDDESQVSFLHKAVEDAQAARVSGLLVWTLYDFPNHADSSEGHYGLLRADDTLKPGADIFLNQ